MKPRIAACILSLVVAVLPLSLGGCSNSESTDESSQIGTKQSEENCSGNSSTTFDNTSASSTENVDRTPSGNPTFLIGLDREPIYTGEITRLENTDKTSETLTEEDLFANVYCDGFTYLKEPSGVAYDSFKNPEMFDGFDFKNEIPENKNAWKRVYVGDEICGLKVKSASVHFMVNDFDEYKFPEKFLESAGTGCELEGTLEIEGFFQILPNNIQYPFQNELINFYPCEAKLPLSLPNPDKEKGIVTKLQIHTLFNHNDDFVILSENNYIELGYLGEIGCDTDGIGRGDLARARVTLGNIKLNGSGISASLEKVERLSEILAHDKDSAGGTTAAPVQ